MEREKFEKFLTNAKIEKYKWCQLEEIDSFVLNNGIGIYPNWKHLRFYISDKEILVEHGTSVPYGGRLSSTHRFSYDYLDIAFMPNLIIQPSKYYQDLPEPKTGDILVSTDGDRVLSESIIMMVSKYTNETSIHVATSIKNTSSSKISFYDPSKYDKALCNHNTVDEGIYMRFCPNQSKKVKDGLPYHDSFKIKDITEIHLSLKCNKIYKVN